MQMYEQIKMQNELNAFLKENSITFRELLDWAKKSYGYDITAPKEEIPSDSALERMTKANLIKFIKGEALD